jgi:hypothetical protein
MNSEANRGPVPLRPMRKIQSIFLFNDILVIAAIDIPGYDQDLGGCTPTLLS